MTFPSREDITLSAWAHAYAEAGWPVFPLIPRDKRPIPTKGFLAASTDHDLIDAWWGATEDANIGIATGRAFDVLDIDGPIGVHFLKDFIGDRYLHNGPVSLTGKGWHLLFEPSGRGNGANLGGDTDTPSKIDFRGIGGYIVAPPSVHPLGHRYMWDEERGPDLGCPPSPEWLPRLLDFNTTPTTTNRAPIIAAGMDYQQLAQLGAINRRDVPRGFRTTLTRPDILEVAEELGLPIRRRSHYYVTNCIYHEDSTPSLTLYPHNNTFYCYGCGAHGDSWDLRDKKHI